MSHVVVPRDDSQRAESFWIPFGGGAMLKCPECRDKFLLSCSGPEGHSIGPDGAVTPSVVCPGEGCSWHVHVRLEDWEPA